MNETKCGFASYLSDAELGRRTQNLLPLDLVSNKLDKQGVRIISDREFLGCDIFGDLFTIGTNIGLLVERTYGCRPSYNNTPPPYRYRRMSESKKIGNQTATPSFTVLDGNGSTGYIDPYLCEVRALSQLRDIRGIPEMVVAICHEGRGCVIEKYINGFHICDLTNFVTDPILIRAIFTSIRETFLGACRRGYFIHHLVGSAILIENGSLTPYLLDWQNHSYWTPNTPDARRFVADSLAQLDQYEQYFLSELSKHKIPTTEVGLGH